VFLILRPPLGSDLLATRRTLWKYSKERQARPSSGSFKFLLLKLPRCRLSVFVCLLFTALRSIIAKNRTPVLYRSRRESPYKNQYRRAAETETTIDEKREIKRKKKNGRKKRERSLRYRSNATQMVCDNKLSASGITADCDGQVHRQKPTRMDY